jgi:hypothetical protein
VLIKEWRMIFVLDGSCCHKLVRNKPDQEQDGYSIVEKW